ncbi:probable glycosyltransferase At5g03795 [Olea europaea var. sylvestris]|uniref:probable glycosyltransferase At5g03795 n=1 Tax=Olea europaea var. sylvestris TaxID=158386 RepID=UPI000C1D87DD|nr:probable glycosyltransferase At5g03795 [Olea europaea var. sylvestris]
METNMWLPKKQPSNLIFIFLTPLVLISVVACIVLQAPELISSPSSLSWKSFGFFKSYSLISFKVNRNRIFNLVGQVETSPNEGLLHQKLVANERTDNNQSSPFEKKREKVVIKKYSRVERLEAILAKARSSIQEAARNKSSISNHQDPDYVPQGAVYRNANAFHRSYLEMEKLFKIYVYEEGEPPIFHDGPCRSIYSTEGRLINELERGNFYRTKNPDEALVYFLPFSVVVMVKYLYEPGSHNMHAIGRTVADYIDTVSGKYPFWNRTLGADHFMLSCHDWGPRSTSYVPQLYNNSIRVLCNANTSEGFNPLKDVSLPEINLKTGELTGLIGGSSPSERSILAFFAGHLHGDIRYLLLQQWKGKDQDVQVYEEVPKNVSYESMLKKSKFCLCPSGYEVASPRVVEAIYAECVPVLISDGYVPPMSDVLIWETFSVFVEVKDIPNIKKILMGISQEQYLRMYERVKQVQRHFVINGPPKRFDLFHMMIHSIWLRRLNMRIHD